MTTRCGEVLVTVAVAGEVAVVGYHAGVEEVGLAYHHPIELGGIGKLCLVLALQPAVEGGVDAGVGHGVHHGGEESHVVKHVGVVGADMDRLQGTYREATDGAGRLLRDGAVDAVDMTHHIGWSSVVQLGGVLQPVHAAAVEIIFRL